MGEPFGRLSGHPRLRAAMAGVSKSRSLGRTIVAPPFQHFDGGTAWMAGLAPAMTASIYKRRF